MSDKKLINFKVPEDTHKKLKAKLDHGELSERLRETVDAIAYGAEVAEHKRTKEALQEARKDKRDIESDIDTLRDERDEKEREIERLESKLDSLMEQEGQYDGFLQSIEEQMHAEEMRVFPEHAQVKKAAGVGGISPEEVVADLRERNPSLPDQQFEQAEPHSTATAQ